MEPSRNFDLRLSGTLAAVSVEVIDSPAGQTPAAAILPCTVSPQALEDLRDSAPGIDLKAIGSALWRCAFGAPAVAELWRASRAGVGDEGILRLRLTIDAAELAALPWELLYDETLGRFLALDGQTPVTRFTRLPISSAPWPQDRPLRLLFTGASPSDMFTLRVGQEWEGIEQMIAPLVKQGRLEVPDPLPEGATLSSLLAALRRKVDVWHFAGHGTDSGLVFCKDHSRSHPVDAGELGQMLLGEGVRLAVINACRAGAGGGQAASVAGALLRAGIPSVVAMQADVSDTAADAFAGAFYDAIAVGQGVDQAVTAARKAIWAAGTSEWWTPALFMRTPEGRIWRVLVKTVTEARARELAYLDGVIEKYKYWAEKYTPLAGVAEVRVAAADSHQLDLPDPFIPVGFEKLVEHGFGAEPRIERVPVNDLRKAVAKYMRLVVLGEPGSGKTTTLWRLAYDFAVAARRDPQAPLPLLVPLEAYSGPESALAYAQGYFEELGPHLPTYLRSKRVILLLDALNQMPQIDRTDRVERIQALLDQYHDVSVVVTCRALDYVETLKLEKLEVKPLKVGQQRAYLHRYLDKWDKFAGEKLFWQLCGGEEIADLWQKWQLAGGTWKQFWTAPDIPHDVRLSLHYADAEMWRVMRKDGPPPLQALGRNPFMLVMLAQVYVANKGVLPQNRGRLFAAFVDTLLRREEKHCDPLIWPGADPLRRAMTSLAYAMQTAGEFGTAVDAGWAAKQMAQQGIDGDKVVYLCASASLLDISNSQVRFVHQLVQEYFAALALAERLQQGDDLRQYWSWSKGQSEPFTFLIRLPDFDPQLELLLLISLRLQYDHGLNKHSSTDWAQPSGWEETFILLAGMLPTMTPLIEQLLPVNPALAARCIAESGGERPSMATIREVQDRLVGVITSSQSSVLERNAAGVAINHVGDPRRGVGLYADGLPDIEWVFVPAKDPKSGREEFIYGDEWKSNREVRTERDFWIARYPITYSQFQAFLDAPDGFRIPHWWDGLAASPEHHRDAGEQRFKHWNHPRENVSWYDAVAFCRWLTEKAKGHPNLLPVELNRGRDWKITLPTEWQWEKAARGHDGRQFPWAGEYERGIYLSGSMAGELFLDKTTPVGMYPHTEPNDSPYGIADLISNVWEWCLNEYYSPENVQEKGTADRVLRGGSSDMNHDFQPAYLRNPYSPDMGNRTIGFRVVIVGSTRQFLSPSHDVRNGRM